MRRKPVIILAILAVVIVGAYLEIKSYIETIETNLNQVTKTSMSDIDISKVADGVYTGICQAFPVTAEVKVTIKDHRISEIELVKHVNGRGARAEAIPYKVIESQTLAVDAVSGATHSSKVILKAIENALSSANQ
jgi:uncharacterized protein with FMN-binding domain